MNANWRQAGWNLQKHEVVLHNIAWAGLPNSFRNKVGPLTPKCGRFDTLDEFYNVVMASEVTHLENKMIQHQQQQQLQQPQKKQPTFSSSKGGKRGQWPSISDSADNPGSGKSGQSGSSSEKSGGRDQSSWLTAVQLF